LRIVIHASGELEDARQVDFIRALVEHFSSSGATFNVYLDRATIMTDNGKTMYLYAWGRDGTERTRTNPPVTG
jgi:hypothetical protein